MTWDARTVGNIGGEVPQLTTGEPVPRGICLLLLRADIVLETGWRKDARGQGAAKYSARCEVPLTCLSVRTVFALHRTRRDRTQVE